MTAPSPAVARLAAVALQAARLRAELAGRAGLYPRGHHARLELDRVCAALAGMETTATTEETVR